MSSNEHDHLHTLPWETLSATSHSFG